MKITGIIAEYNPFHNGHAYHLAKTREITGADGVIAVMSGDFVQRGVPAAVDKYRRTEMALRAGVDLVLELPVFYASGSAEIFARGAVQILRDLGCVTDLVYGCETDRPEQLKELASLLAEEPPLYRTVLKEQLKTGVRFPAAREAAIEACAPGLSALVSEPNNTLAIEYEKAILRSSADIRGHGLLRSDSGYHVTGSMIRNALSSGEPDALAAYLPEASRALLDYRVTPEALLPLYRYQILTAEPDALASCTDVGADLAARIKRLGPDIEALSSRNYTQARIRRALLHILLEIREEPEIPFIRVLGFRSGTPVLKACKETASRPLLTKIADAPAGSWTMDTLASDVYRILAPIPLPDEYRAGPIMI